MSEKKLISRKEIAKKYNVTPLTVCNWHNQKKIKSVKRQGSKYLYDAAQVEAFNQTRNSQITNEVYSIDGSMENGYALTYKGWLAFSKRKRLADVPPREIYAQYSRPISEDK